jgi:hypothetical protein
MSFLNLLEADHREGNVAGCSLTPAVRHDFIACARYGGRNAYLLLHDTNIYLREMIRHAGVKRWLKSVKTAKDAFELVDLPISSGLAIVRVLSDEAWTCLTSPRQR